MEIEMEMGINGDRGDGEMGDLLEIGELRLENGR